MTLRSYLSSRQTIMLIVSRSDITVSLFKPLKSSPFQKRGQWKEEIGDTATIESFERESSFRVSQ